MADNGGWKQAAARLFDDGWYTSFRDEQIDDGSRIGEKHQLTCGHYADPFWRFCPHCGCVIMPSSFEY